MDNPKELKQKAIKKTEQDSHPVLNQKRTLGQKSADFITSWMGSWTFIIILIILMFLWIWFNGYYLIKVLNGIPFDPYPFILLNLALACLTTIQVPIILMSQNREAQKDRLRAEYDYAVNRKAAREVGEIQKQLDRIERRIMQR